MPVTPDDALALVRLNITDLGEGPDQVLSDRQIKVLLRHFDGSTNRATARALRIIAASEVLVGKVIRTQDLQTAGDRVAESLRKLAADYDGEAEAEESEDHGALHLVPFNARGRRAETEEYRGGVY